MEDDIASRAATLAALGHADRLAAFRLLVRAGHAGLPSGTVARMLDIQPTRMSFHLARLEQAGLARRIRRGREVFYSADFDATERLLDFLMQDCCAGVSDLHPGADGSAGCCRARSPGGDAPEDGPADGPENGPDA